MKGGLKRGNHLGLIRCECNVNFFQSFDPFGGQRVANLLEALLGAHCDLAEFEGSNFYYIFIKIC